MPVGHRTKNCRKIVLHQFTHEKQIKNKILAGLIGTYIYFTKRLEYFNLREIRFFNYIITSMITCG